MKDKKELQDKKKTFWKEKTASLYSDYLWKAKFSVDKNITNEERIAFFEQCYSWKIPNLSMSIKRNLEQNIEQIDLYIAKTKILSLNYLWYYRLELLDYMAYIRYDITQNTPQQLYSFLVVYTQHFEEWKNEWLQTKKKFCREKRQQELAIQYIHNILEKLEISHYIKTKPTYFSLCININEQQIELKLSYSFVMENIHKALPKLFALYKLVISSGLEFQINQIYRDY